jgi:Mce-associated membrane protein
VIIRGTASDDATQSGAGTPKRRTSPMVAQIAISLCAFLLVGGAGLLKWHVGTAREVQLASVQSVDAAKNGAIAMLSYQPGTVEQQLTGARRLLGGALRDSYTSLINNVVIPGARQRQVTVEAAVPSSALVTAGADHAVVLLFVNQTVTIGGGQPAQSGSSVRVTLSRAAGRWLITAFDPV